MIIEIKGSFDIVVRLTGAAIYMIVEIKGSFDSEKKAELRQIYMIVEIKGSFDISAALLFFPYLHDSRN